MTLKLSPSVTDFDIHYSILSINIDNMVILVSRPMPNHSLSDNTRLRMAKASRASKNTAQRIGGKIRQFRKSFGLTQAGLAEKMEIDDMTISRFETGVRAPSLDQLEKLSEVFRVPMGHFLDESEDSSLIRGREIASMLTGLTKEQQHFIIEIVRLYVDTHGNKVRSS